MGNNLNFSQNPQDVNRRLLGLEYLSQEGDFIESTKLFTIVKLTPDSQNYLLGKVHLKQRDLSSYKSAYEDTRKKLLSRHNSHILHSDLLDSGDFYLLIRQYIDKTLRKKLRTPPFFNSIEKTWLSFQCLKAVDQLHSLDLTHGDIKAENFLLTSWNWMYLSDVGFYKPSYLAEGDLTSYKLFFSASERPACYLAPEKFVTKGSDEGRTKEMDVFSLACVIAEIWLDGQYVFTLPELLQYKRTGVALKLAQIKEPEVRAMLQEMMSLNPTARKTVSAHLDYYKSVIPEEIVRVYDLIARMMLNVSNPDAYSRIHFISKQILLDPTSDLLVDLGQASSLLATCVTSSILDLRTPAQVVESLQLLIQLARTCSDYCKLHKILPFILHILQNKTQRPKVKVECIHSILDLLSNVVISNARDSHLFPEYIWTSLAPLSNDESEYVRSELAKVLPEIAALGLKFLKAFHDFNEKPADWQKDFEGFTEKFVKTFKVLVVSKPECQVQVEILRSFADMSESLDKRAVLNNIVPIILSWLNKGDYYRSLILGQVPKLLTYMNTDEFSYQIFTCIEDGLNHHNELVVYKTLKVFEKGKNFDKNVLEKIVKSCMHPSKWVQESAFNLLTSLVRKMDLIQNFSVLREVATGCIDLPVSNYSVVTVEILQNFMKKIKRIELKTSKIFSRSRSKELKIPASPLLLKEKFPVYELASSNPKTHKPRFSIGSLKTRETFALSGKLVRSFNEHDCSVPNLHIHEGHLVSASSSRQLKLWSLQQLDPFQAVKCKTSLTYTSQISSLGTCGDNFFISSDQGISLYSDLSLSTSLSIPGDKLLKTIALSTQSLSSIDQKGQLSIFDTRTLSSVQSYKFPFHGPLSNICQGPHESILCLSTYIGAIVLYDIRFACPSSILYHSSGLPIFSIHSYDSRSLLVGSEDISILDVYTTGVSSLLSSSNDSPRIPAFCESIEKDWLVHSCFDIGKRMQKVFESQGTVRKILSPGKPFVLSAGNDSLIKVWNVEKPQESCVIGQSKKDRPYMNEINYGDVKIIQQIKGKREKDLQLLPRHSLKRRVYEDCPQHRSKEHTDAILDMVLSPDATVLVTSSRDGSVKVWN